MKTYKVRIKKLPMKMGGKPMYQQGVEVPEDNLFGSQPVQGSLKGAVTLPAMDTDYPLISIPAPKAAPTAAAQPAVANTNSIYDYLTAQGKNGSFSARKELAEQMGIKNYKGTAAQNLAMLKALRSGSAAEPKAVVTKTPAGKVNVQNFAPTAYEYTNIPGAGFGDGWDEPTPTAWESAIEGPMFGHKFKRQGKQAVVKELSAAQKKRVEDYINNHHAFSRNTIPGDHMGDNWDVQRPVWMPNYIGTPYREMGGYEMAYGGQIGYGLDLNSRRVYTDMPEEPQIERTLAPVSPEDATYEAEKGEVLIGDPDKDGNNETMVFGGKRHSQGGTPANEPGFIYSDTKSMRLKGPVLEEFGKTAGKAYTPAEIAKQYDLTKYKAVMDDPNADDLQKKTAQIMYENYERKLGKLAAVQESMKGFPQGLPEVAKKFYPEMEESVAPVQYISGGFTFQKGGTPKWLTPWTKSNTFAGRMSKTDPSMETTYNAAEGNTLLQDYDYWKGLAGRDFTDLKDMQNFVFGKLANDNTGKDSMNQMLDKFGYPAANTLADGILGRRSAWAFKQRIKNGTAPTPAATPASVTQTAKATTPAGEKKTETPATETKPAAVDAQLNASGAATKLPYNAFDVMNLMSAVSTPVKSYGPRMFLPDVQEMQGVYDTPDYNPYLAAANTRAQMNATFGNAGAAMAANTYNPELLQGMAQEAARVRGNNMQTANQISGQNTQIRNQNNMLRAQLMQDNYDKWVKTQEETDIANKLKWRQDVAPAAQNMVNNRINMQRYNDMYPQYAVTGPLWDNIAFQGNGYKVGQKAPQGTGNDMATFLSQFPGMKALYESNDPAKKMQVEQEFLKFQNQQMANMARNPRNMYYNRNGYNPDLDK